MEQPLTLHDMAQHDQSLAYARNAAAAITRFWTETEALPRRLRWRLTQEFAATVFTFDVLVLGGDDDDEEGDE